MCGIFGFNFTEKNLAVLIKKSLTHRGPNHSEIYEDNNLTLGYTRLSIIDLKSGNQPIYNEDKSILVFCNGEIYNYIELRHILEKKGHKFRTDCDTEVIVHAYEEYGTNCANYFNGMFAFCVYDIKKKKVFIARDRLGIKPLFYFFENNEFIFASELKAILNHKPIKKKVNLESLSNYLTYRYTVGNKTIINNVNKLLPGHYLEFFNNTINIKPYWALDFKTKKLSFSQASSTFRKLFDSSVKYRLNSDVPVGALLSGGLDSSSIVALMSKYSNESIKTYTLGFENSKDNEFKFAKTVSEKFETDHKEIMIDSTYMKHFPKIVYYLDEPIADPTSIPNYILAKKASKDVKVLLNGEGADELFMGYEQYKYMKYMNYYNKFPKLIKKSVQSSISLFPKEPFFYKFKEFINPHNDTPKSYKALVSIFGDSEKNLLLKSNLESPSGYTKQFFENNLSYNQKFSYHDISTFLPDNMLAKFDRTTMAHSVEGRVPFCDHRIAEFACSLPVEHKFQKQDKLVIRKALKGILPKNILERPKKRFFVPTNQWYKKELGEYTTTLFDDNHEIVNEFFNEKYINKLLNKERMLSHWMLKADKLRGLYYSRQLWTITNFVQWYDIFINENKTF